ncbi:hypothetical protein ACKI1J_42895 [Streptomyces scabiei]|uniref:hypothetical protein n=1 Tax=Streptomyces TaxID=1883 RepID=UPI0029B2991C|nr:hypothetical protein [Streptomyces stelliscabiei]MDX2552572.1 hypothetical protein [Streptomyces stelliscabiei]
MTREERRAYIRRIVDAAPTLTAEDADFVRGLMPLQGRTARRQAQRSVPPAPSRTAAA